MLREVENRHPDAAFIFGDPLSGTIDLETLLAAARRQLRFVLTCALAGLVLGLAYLAAEVPLYESTARILIDKNQPSVVTKLTESGSSTQLDPMMLSQVELLRSDRIGLKVVDSLGLATDRAFLSAPYSLLNSFTGLVAWVRSSIGSSEERGAPVKPSAARGPDRWQAFGTLAENLTVARVGDSYILQIQFQSPSAEIAQKITNKYAEIYISDQVGAKDESIIRARSALAEEVETVRKRSVDAELAVHRFRTNTVLTKETLVTLRQLELEASSLKSQYEQVLQQYQASLQNLSMALTEARIISEASYPGGPSSPNSIVTLAICAVLGGMIGAGVGGIREYRERFFRTRGQVRDELGLDTLGMIPLLDGKPIRRNKRDPEAGERSFIEVGNTAFNWVEQHPRSEFAEAMRTVKVAVDVEIPRKSTKAIGIVSCLPGEGKSLVAANFAMVLAMQRCRTLLIDADIHNPGLSPMLANGWERGLANLLAGDFNARDMLAHQSLPLRFLPGVNQSQQKLAKTVQPIEKMGDFLIKAGSTFNYVVVDLPPLAPVADVRSFVQHLDGLVLVVEWGVTARTFVRECLNNNPILADKCIGVLLNKVDIKRIKLYQKFGSAEFYSERYGQYYQS
ncbi:Wzz/FepE/Etk N-terminal domain-containing protein [Mesorhizobium amorphae]|uniref:Wzz/FepE/Etk N-terminal domain-containing protein n=1 Tax=Mesorhizobium amorphae TaxID=71433 RepID=UPI00177F5D8D|nr:Wzz/FepE/Etk N-terminal domain-containing protein [Mesorhizobium amorphae]